MNKPVDGSIKIIDTTYLDNAGNIVNGFRITFTLENGNTYFVEVPKLGFSPEKAKQAIQERIEQITLTESVFD